jgi:hypothetical protein
MVRAVAGAGPLVRAPIVVGVEVVPFPSRMAVVNIRTLESGRGRGRVSR